MYGRFRRQGRLTHGCTPRQQGRKRPSCILTLTALIGFFSRSLSCKRNLVKELAPLVSYFRVFVPQPHLTFYGA
jgi:hypothetical protein